MTKQEALEHAKRERDACQRKVEDGNAFYQAMVDYLDVIIECIEKQIPREPIWRWDGNETIIECPNCGKYPFDMSEYEWARQFCGNCGQSISWGHENDADRSDE